MHFAAGPDGLSWSRAEWPEPWTCPRDVVAGVKLHVSPPAVRRTHPVTVLLALTDGTRHLIGNGSMAEGRLIAESIEAGLGLTLPDDPTRHPSER